MTAAFSGLQGKRVLVLEDEFFLADDLALALRAAGAAVVGPFARLEAALAAVEAGPDPDLAVMDINLAGEPCYALADALAARGVPHVFVTGYDRNLIAPTYAHVPRFEKPIDVRRLVRSLGG